jgi:hypothetical protein
VGIGSFKVEGETRQGIALLDVAAQRNLLEGLKRAGVNGAEQRPIVLGNDLADRIMRQTLRVIADKVRIKLLVTIRRLRRYP